MRAKQYEIRTRGNGLRHIKAGPNPAIHNQGKPVADGSTDMRQLVKRMRRRIELTAGMIGHNQPVTALPHGTFRVLAVKNALEKELARPAVTDGVQIVPIEPAIKLRPDEFGDRQLRRPVGIGFHIAKTRPAIRQHAKRPVWPAGGLQQHGRAVHGIARLPSGAPAIRMRSRRLGAGTSAVTTRVSTPQSRAAPHQIEADVPIMRRVKLKPGHIAANGGDALNGFPGNGAQGVGKPVCLGGGRKNPLSPGPDGR